MISVISLLDERKNGTNATCVIDSTHDAIVPEIEAILTSIYNIRPDEFIDAMGNMMERIKRGADDNS